MQTKSFRKLDGTVEADETFIGGAARFMHKNRKDRTVKGTGGLASGKTAVMGLLERHGEVRARVVPNARAKTLQPQVRKNVKPGAELFTDAHHGYTGLSADYQHQVVDHAERYVSGRVHTNGMENFWSLLKRCIKGTYISVEPFHTFRYIDEETFRFNTRKQTDGERFNTVLGQVSGRRLDYKRLTGIEQVNS
jgi:transposase-like protein